ncbi:Fe-S cluster assembly protein DRE2 [Massariosphaeria phaeospora]|uniref:Fe-S cluster assembly protein DRE2 n=1 Tax=Massariosphaeria phaeospora TaxID=100035 RepID=A0A7C8M9F7_9PLEO|nr:Fe-S cluster assembly protein DRE2 [Massariosphaeria phaeospora]
MAPRTLLLAPPSIAARPHVLDKVYEGHDRSSADLQMLDRVAAGLAKLPPSTYDVVLLLTDADGFARESYNLLGREVMASVVKALKTGGTLKSQDGVFGASQSAEKTEAILAGLVDGADGMMKPEDVGPVSIPLKLGKRKARSAADGLISGVNGTNGVNKASDGDKAVPPIPKGNTSAVGFVDFGDDLDDPIVTGEDDELIDEDDLITAEDMAHPIIQPPECRPKAGKRRRACKDCTCGLKEKIEAEDAGKRVAADQALDTMKLDADNLTEDFTVPGKVGSCGSCALGDAFRCDGCPYIGLPAFKPGEEVRMLNNDVQL